MRNLLISVVILMCIHCGGKGSTTVLEIEPGCTISVSSVSVSKPERRVNGILVIENKAESFVKVSNQELFMHSGSDSVRTYVALAGKWQIDDGLINVLKGKKITLQVYWPILPEMPDSITFGYVKLLDR